MSERSVEDELMSEARKFAASMSMTLRRYSQAANWLDKRKIRKEITKGWRTELRQAERDRAHQLTWTAQSVEHFRAHSLAVSQRANDPSVDHDRRYRDAQALARHRNEMAERVLRNPHLTPVEQGIALDGLDSASAFPEFANKGLFDRAQRVKGREALRYRAQVARAREAAGLERPAVQPMRHVDRAERTEQLSTQVVFGDPDRSGQGPRRDEREQQQRQVPAGAADAGRFRAVLGWTDRHGVTFTRSQSFDSELAATAWMRSNPGTMLTFGVSAHAQAWDNRDDRAPLYSHSGEHRAVWASLAAREEALAREQEAGRDGVSRESQPVRVEQAASAAESDTTDLAREFSSLKDRHRLSIQHNNALTTRNGALVKQLSVVTAERDTATARLAALTTERDQLLGERDEAVRELAERTPAEHRFGSAERQAAQARNDAQRGEEPDRAEGFVSDIDAAERDQAGEDSVRTVVRGDDPATTAADAAWARTGRGSIPDAGLDTRDAKKTKTKTRAPIPGHAFAGMVNGRNQDQEMER
jgi:hypothetical protein